MAVKVEVFSSPGCTKCARAKEVLLKLVHDLNEELGGDHIRWREVNILEELDYAVSLGVLSAPAIAIDDELVFTSLPSARKLRAALLDRLGKET